VDGTRPDRLPAVRELYREYADSLGIDLSFQAFDRELAELPGAYGEARGLLLLALVDGRAAGCVGLRDRGGGVAELKRLYVRPAFRGLGLGRRLTLETLGAARTLGHRRVVLDTLPGMGAAQALYESLGFEDVEPYTENPISGTRFLGLDLARPRLGGTKRL
jgi:ribosomal protein S18 acetylase RimI-like enzyme